MKTSSLFLLRVAKAMRVVHICRAKRAAVLRQLVRAMRDKGQSVEVSIRGKDELLDEALCEYYGPTDKEAQILSLKAKISSSKALLKSLHSEVNDWRNSAERLKAELKEVQSSANEVQTRASKYEREANKHAREIREMRTYLDHSLLRLKHVLPENQITDAEDTYAKVALLNKKLCKLLYPEIDPELSHLLDPEQNH